MGDPITFSVDEMEQRRRRASAARKASIVRPPSPPKVESEAMAVINEIFNPTYKKPVTKGNYRAPDEVSADDLEAMKDLDIRKLAELKEVFLLLDLDSDGLISKDDLRFTFSALGTDTPDELIEEMLKEAKDPLDYEAFIELMSHRTVELDPEDVLLEAWSKWDDYGTGKIEEKKIYEELTNYGDVMTNAEANEALKYAPIAKAKTLEEPTMIDYPAFCRILCSEYIEIFPFLREPVIENSTNPDYVICNRTTATAPSVSALASTTAATASAANGSVATTKTTKATHTMPPTAAEVKQKATTPVDASIVSTVGSVANHAHLTVIAANNSAAAAVAGLRGNEFIYSAGKFFGIRVRYSQPQQQQQGEREPTLRNITGEYRFLKKEHFHNDGRLIPGSYCDYYFFADPNAKPESFEIWRYFHSPRFPAKYPAHIKCAYKFIGRPESRVEIVFEELHLPKKDNSCSMDKLTIFDSESANMNAVIDVICDALPTRRIISSGPDLLIEFNASSNRTAKGFRGKFKFIHNEIEDQFVPAIRNEMTTEKIVALERIDMRKETQHPVLTADAWGKFFKNNENCKQIFDSRVNKSGRFDTSQLFPTVPNVNIIPVLSPSRVQCRFEFYGGVDERVQIKFLDFHIPAENKNSTECKSNDVLQLLTQVRGKYEPAETFCGPFLPKPIMSNGPKMLLQFIGRYPPTGTKINYYGFKAEYKFVKNFGISTGQQIDDNCTFTYNSTDRKSGWFGSPNFPGFYPQNMVCHYYFYGEPDERVIIRFTFFEVEGIGTCEYLTASDYVEFSNFMSTDRKYGRYCGKREKFEVRSDGRFFRVSFYSNDRFDKTGFRALYDYQGKSSRVENTSMQSYISGCGDIVNSYYTLKIGFALILLYYYNILK